MAVNEVIEFGEIDVFGTPSDQLYTPMSGTAGVTTPKTTVKIQSEKFDTGPKIEGSDKPIKKAETVQDVIKQEGATTRQLEAFQSGAKFFADVLNAQSAYFATTGQAQLNIIQSRNQAADALYRGRQAQMEAQSEGRQAGESALLAMAVQGQDVSGASVGKIQSSYEAMGVFNGMREEINSIREALGFQLEEVAYNYQIRNAEIARNSAILGSAIQAGAGLVGVL